MLRGYIHEVPADGCKKIYMEKMGSPLVSIFQLLQFALWRDCDSVEACHFFKAVPVYVLGWFWGVVLPFML